MKSPTGKIHVSEPNIDIVLSHENVVAPRRPTTITKQVQKKKPITGDVSRIQASVDTTNKVSLQEYLKLRTGKDDKTHRSSTSRSTASTATYSLSPLTSRITSILEEALLSSASDKNMCSSSNPELLWITSAPLRKKTRKFKKNVTFAMHRNVYIPYNTIDATHTVMGCPISINDRKASIAILWYTAQDYAQFRTECNDMATYALGDVDYQHFFMNTLYPYCCSMARSIRKRINATTSPSRKSSMAPPLSPTDSDTDSTTSVCTISTETTESGSFSNSSHSSELSSSSLFVVSSNDMVTTTEAEAIELEMIRKYRGLERIIFRHIVQDLKMEYIKFRVKEAAESCYFDDDDDDCTMGSHDDTMSDKSSQPSVVCHYVYTSQCMAQFLAQIDRLGVLQDNQDYYHRIQQQIKERNQRKADHYKNRNKKNQDQKYDTNFCEQTIEI
jgi:hypothetical protein